MNLAKIADRFARDTATHQLTILHDDGLYRHLRFRATDSSFYWFDLITWPGKLAFVGDGDGYVFSRVQDMFQFFRGHEINPGYWAEKVVAGRNSIRRYSEDRLRQLLDDALAYYERAYPDLASKYEIARAEYDALPVDDRYPYGRAHEPHRPETVDEVRKTVSDHDDEGLLGYEDGARELLSELEQARVVSDTWEWDLHDYDWWYLWACHAVVWGIAQYDAARAQPAAVAR